MTQILKQSTQIDVRVGPFVAVGDGFTPVTTAEINLMDEAEILKANGAATTAAASTDTGLDFMSVTGCDGWVDLRLSTTDTNTVGTLDVVFQDDSLFLPVHARFQVVEELVYDRLYGTDATAGDTGSISTAVWNATTRAITTADGNAFDTGVFTGGAGTDTGLVSNAVWNSLAASHVTADSYGILLSDTGDIADAVWAYSSRIATSVSGAVGSVSGNVDGSVASVTTVSANAIDTGSYTLTAAFANDTGALVNKIWAATSRTISAATNITSDGAAINTTAGVVDSVTTTATATTATNVTTISPNAIDTGSFTGALMTGSIHDTGIADTIWKYSTSSATGDTGSVGYAQGRLMAVKGDTGAAHLDAGRLGVSAAATVDTGEVSDAVWGKRTPGDSTRALTANTIDTGIYTGAVMTGSIHDTGIADTVWKYSTSNATGDTGSVGYAQGRLMAVKGDTGAAHLDAGRLGVSAAATVDTGEVSDAVWGKRTPGDSTRALTANTLDTGIFTGGAGTDTGLVSNAVWNSLAASHVTADSYGILLSDTGDIADAVWAYSTSNATGDTGSVAYAQGRLMAVKGDTGAAHLDAGRLGVSAAATVDTGEVSDAVWGKRTPGDSTRALTANTIDTGIYTGTAANSNDTGTWVNSVWGATSRVATSVSGNVDGSVASVTTVTANAIDTGSFTGGAGTDTGLVSNAVWNSLAASHTTADSYGILVSDTGDIADAVWAYSTSGAAGDTGSVAYAQGRLMAVNGDTGAAHLDAGRLGVSATASLDTGATKDAVWGTTPGTSTRELTANAIDTGTFTGTASAANDTGRMYPASSNITQVNGTAVTGSGTAGDPWGP